MVMRLVKIFLILFFIILTFWLLWFDFVPGKSLAVNYDFCTTSRMLTEFSPGDRLWPVEKGGGECWQRMAKSPVYFDVRTPQVFKTAEVEIKYKNLGKEKFQIGPQIVKNEWQWVLVDILPTEQRGEWQVARINFDLSQVYQGAPMMRWLISAPTIEQNQQNIVISTIKIVFKKDQFSFANATEQIKNYLRKIKR